LLHDNGFSYSALAVKTCFGDKTPTPMQSHDIEPESLLVFLGGKLHDIEGIKENVMAGLNAVSLETFVDYLKIFKICNKRIKVGGDYFQWE
jgi:hypothetical protein